MTRLPPMAMETPAPRAARRARRGVSTMLSLGVLAVLLLVGAAVLDMGRMAVTRGRLQSSADAIAQAGGLELMDLSVLVPGATDQQSLDPTQITTWQAAHAQQIAEAMLTEQVERGALHTETIAPHGNVALGSYDPRTRAFVEWEGVGAPSAIQVRLGYTAAGGNPLRLFLAPLIGLGDVEVVSTAYIARNVVGFEPTTTANVPLVPLLLDHDNAANGWYTQAAARTSAAHNDRFAVTATGEIYDEQDDVPELVFKLSQSAWTLALGDDKPSDWSELASQGLGEREIAQLAAPLGKPAAMDEQALMQTLAALKGTKRVWPLGAKNSQGSLELTGFAAGQVVECYINEQAEIELIIQPCVLTTETAILGDGVEENPWIGKLVMAY